MRKLSVLLAVTILAVHVTASQIPGQAPVPAPPSAPPLDSALARKLQSPKVQKAIEQYKEDEKKGKVKPETSYNVGSALHDLGEYQEAVDVLNKALVTKDPTLESEAFYNLGNTYFRMQDYQKASESFQESLKRSPNDADAKVNYRDVLAARATMIYELGAKTNLKGDLNFNGTDYRNLQAFQDMSVRAGIEYKVGSKTAVGVAGVYGVMETTVAQALANTESTTQQQAALAPLVAQQTAATAAALEAINVTLADLDKKYAEDVKAENDKPRLNTPEADAAHAQALKTINDKYTTDRETLVKQYDAANVLTVRRNKATNAAAAKQAKRKAASRASTSRQFYKQLLLTASYEATGKLFFNLDFGMDFREYEGEASVDSRTNFTYRLTANYKMRERTMLSLTGGRQVDGSAATLGVSVRRNTIQLGVDQQIGDRFRLAVAGGYDMGQFESSRSDIASDRSDNYLFGKATLTYNFSKTAYISAFYEYRDQSSTEENLTYTNNRYGLQLGVNF